LPTTIVLGILSSLVEGAGLSLFVPLLQSLAPGSYQHGSGGLQEAIDRILGRVPAGHRMEFIVGAILAMTLCKELLTYTHSALASAMNARVTHSIRTRMFSKILALDQARLSEMESGRLINLLATDTWHTSDAISLMRNLITNLCSILVFFTLLVALSPRLTA